MSDSEITCRIAALDHRDRATAERIHAIQVAAYSQEADLLGAASFPPLEKTVEDVERSDDRFLGAYLGEKLVGVVALEGDPASGSLLISSLVVLPAFQRKGVARSLLAAVGETFPAHTLTVSTGEKNGPALALYAGLGFREVQRKVVGHEHIAVIELRRADSMISP
jgi:ribosomal protein S18 acetylase RimI-like enzyme